MGEWRLNTIVDGPNEMNYLSWDMYEKSFIRQKKVYMNNLLDNKHWFT
jgi:hypothetical protein